MEKSKGGPKIPGCLKRSVCPITNTLDLIGDKWTLLVIRDMLFLNKKSFNEFLESPERIATNILADRLKQLEEFGLIVKHPYTQSPLRYKYTLTPRGKGLRPILLEMIRWGNSNIKGTFVPPKNLLNKLKRPHSIIEINS